MEDVPQIPGYRIVDKIGEGGTSLVYQAIQEKLNRKVAIKVLKPVLLKEKEYSSRFLKEARIASNLTHPNIVTIFDVGVVGNYYYIIMEYLEESLQKHIENNSLRLLKNMNETKSIIKLIAEALEYAHSQGVVHRDIKPANILFRDNKTPVLVDFGLARFLDSSSSFTGKGVVVGTFAYMSPEQCKGETVDHYSDIYSFGVVLYEMLTGKPPFRSKSLEGLLSKHLYGTIPRLPVKLRQYQPLIDRMLAKDKRHRLNSARQVSYLLDELMAPEGERRYGRKRKFYDKNIFRVSGKVSNVRFLLPLMILSIVTFVVVIILLMIKLVLSHNRPDSFKDTSQKNITIFKKDSSPFNKLTDKRSNNYKPEANGGEITFTPGTGKYNENVQVHLSWENLRSSNGEEIPSEVYFTINGIAPAKTNDKKYEGKKIILDKPGKHTINAKLFSKKGKYESSTYSQSYIIEKENLK